MLIPTKREYILRSIEHIEIELEQIRSMLAEHKQPTRESVLNELHYYVTGLWAKSKGQPVDEQSIIVFLIRRIPSDAVEPIITDAIESGILARTTNGSYLPRPMRS